MIKLALETGAGVIRQGDSIIFLVKGEGELRKGTLNQVFTSVHRPHDICFGIAEEPYHKTHSIIDVEFIDAALRKEQEK